MNAKTSFGVKIFLIPDETFCAGLRLTSGAFFAEKRKAEKISMRRKMKNAQQQIHHRDPDSGPDGHSAGGL
ncbi:MAG: hypothetical protein J5789_01980 [Oscillospiraceae bacterium]|nr:hypothetical protein [Oscillospiraceae bacterium]